MIWLLSGLLVWVFGSFFEKDIACANLKATLVYNKVSLLWLICHSETKDTFTHLWLVRHLKLWGEHNLAINLAKNLPPAILNEILVHPASTRRIEVNVGTFKIISVVFWEIYTSKSCSPGSDCLKDLFIHLIVHALNHAVYSGLNLVLYIFDKDVCMIKCEVFSHALLLLISEH